MTRKHKLLTLACSLALSINSCNLLDNKNNEDPSPETKGWVKGVLKHQPNYVPDVICEAPCTLIEPLQATLYFTEKGSPSIDGAIPKILDSTRSNEKGEFEKQLPEGTYSLLASYGNHIHRPPSWVQVWHGLPHTFSIEVKAGKTTTVSSPIYF